MKNRWASRVANVINNGGNRIITSQIKGAGFDGLLE